MKLLEWTRTANSTTVSGVNEKPTRVRGSTGFVVNSVFDGTKSFSMSALILPTLCKALPAVDNKVLPEFQHLTLVDPTYYLGGKIDFILGADHMPEFIMHEMIIGSMLAQKTHFGWILSGPYPRRGKVQRQAGQDIQSFVIKEDSDETDAILRKFWETDCPAIRLSGSFHHIPASIEGSRTARAPRYPLFCSRENCHRL